MTVTIDAPQAASATATLAPYCASPYAYQRRRTHEVMVGQVGVGGDNPIRVQSMTTTRTQDIDATVAQAKRLAAVGCEIIRITAPTVKDARALAVIKERLRADGVTAPLVADIHFSPEAALEAAEHVEKVRVNPGNYADSRKFAVREYTDAEYAAELRRIEERFAPLVKKCTARGIAMRIGTNHGSLSDRIVNRFGDTPEGMVESALEFVRIGEKYGYRQIILSMKASNPKVMIAAYRLLAARMTALGMTYPFHLGVTEAGNGEDARIKSAIGIGSLLADGIGDTIRVSLAEEPEEEVPVAFALARRFPPAAPAAAEREQPPLPWDPIHYERRPSAATTIGPITFGNGQPPVVVARAGDDGAAQVLRWASPGARRLQRPEIIELPVISADDVAALHRLAARLDSARALLVLGDVTSKAAPAQALLASGEDAHLLADALPATAGALLRRPSAAAASELGASCAAAGKALWLEAVVGEDEPASAAVAKLLNTYAAARAAAAPELVLAITGATPEASIHAQRLLAARLADLGEQPPLFLRGAPTAEPLLPASLQLGSVLCDGVGDAVQASTVTGGQDEVRFTLNVLQAAGARHSKTDYVACPSCGRTLFDLQSTTERIKAKTAHLVGVKIAIMGCVVNGPGEMADADFGYVGGSPGRVNLFVGKTCVEKGVPAEDADARLVALIKAHGRWQEPEEDGEEGGAEA